jgi:hypothetical protein
MLTPDIRGHGMTLILVDQLEPLFELVDKGECVLPTPASGIPDCYRAMFGGQVCSGSSTCRLQSR